MNWGSYFPDDAFWSHSLVVRVNIESTFPALMLEPTAPVARSRAWLPSFHCWAISSAALFATGFVLRQELLRQELMAAPASTYSTLTTVITPESIIDLWPIRRPKDRGFSAPQGQRPISIRFEDWPLRHAETTIKLDRAKGEDVSCIMQPSPESLHQLHGCGGFVGGGGREGYESLRLPPPNIRESVILGFQ